MVNGQKVKTANLDAGAKATLETDLAAGTYDTLCDIPGDADQGMKGTLNVKQARRLAAAHQLGGHCATAAFRDLIAFTALPAAVRRGEPLLFVLAGGLDFLDWRRPGADPPL